MRPPVSLVEGVPTYAYPNGAVPGPRPPRSWTPLFDEDERHGVAWRARALRLLFDDLRNLRLYGLPGAPSAPIGQASPPLLVVQGITSVVCVRILFVVCARVRWG